MKLYTMKWDYRFLRGRFRGKTVRYVYDLGSRWQNWLVFYYFAVADVSFDDSILAALDVTERIEKPGMDESAFDRWRDAHPMTEEEAEAVRLYKMGEVSHKKAVMRRREQARINFIDASGRIRDGFEGNKALLQRHNQGHKISK